MLATFAAFQGRGVRRALSGRASARMAVSVGDKFPACSMDLGFLGSDGVKVRCPRFSEWRARESRLGAAARPSSSVALDIRCIYPPCAAG